MGNGESTGSISNQGGVSNSGTLALDNPGSSTLVGPINGTGGVKVEDGTVTLSAAGTNTYSGDTTITSSATLKDAASGAFSPTSAIKLEGSARLGANFNETINGLYDDGGGSSTVCIANGYTLTTNGYRLHVRRERSWVPDPSKSAPEPARS